MTNLDQFESTFRSAAKPVYAYEPIDIDRVLVITDLEEYEARSALLFLKSLDATAVGTVISEFVRELKAESYTHDVKKLWDTTVERVLHQTSDKNKYQPLLEYETYIELKIDQAQETAG